MKSKSFCEDLTEGKFSFPIIHCIRQNSKDTRLLSILKQRTKDTEVKRYAQTLLRENGSLLYARKKCAELKLEILDIIKSFDGNIMLENLMMRLDVQLDGLNVNPGVGLKETRSSEKKQLIDRP